MTASRWPRLGAAIVGVAWFVWIGGGPTLNPTHITWLLYGDWMQHWFGWQFFRGEPWRFPIGTIAGLPYPVGTTTGFTDANPLVSMLLKPVASWLPSDFQFIGLWLAACFALQGYAGAALASVVTRRRWQQWLGGCLFVMSPVLAKRVGHDTLCAHWLLLGVLALGLRNHASPRHAHRAIGLLIGLVMLASAIHPYLAAMCFALAQAAYVRFWWTRLVSPVRAVAASSATTAGMLVMFGSLGYVGEANIGSGGFGVYGADVLALINPGTFSRLLPGLRLPADRWEGIGFLGLGGLIAAGIAVATWVRRRAALAGRWPIVAACGLMAIYALSSDVQFAGHPVASVPLPGRAAALAGVFRASGRFIWPLHYLALTCGIWGVVRAARASRPAIGTAILVLLVLAQMADFRMKTSWSWPKPFREASVSAFSTASARYRHLALVPMQVLTVCGSAFDSPYVYRYMRLADQLHWTYNSGRFARMPHARIAAECRRLDEDIDAGILDPETVYVVAPDRVDRLRRGQAACGRIDGEWICVSRDSDERFRAVLARAGDEPRR